MKSERLAYCYYIIEGYKGMSLVMSSAAFEKGKMVYCNFIELKRQDEMCIISSLFSVGLQFKNHFTTAEA